MRVLVTGASGYVGSKLIPVLWQAGHQVVVIVRNKADLQVLPLIYQDLEIIEGDLLTGEGLEGLSLDIDAAYYLVHSMKHRSKGFFELEAKCAENFKILMDETGAKQVIYISGLSPKQGLSEHMASRQNVEEILKDSQVPLTVLRAGIVIGEGSISFEIIRDLVETLPVMITPRWVMSKCQPIGIKDMLTYLEQALGHPECIGKSFEVGGPDVLTYRQILIAFAKFRGLKRVILPIPVLSPRLSSLWLCLITNANFSVAKALVKSLSLDAVCEQNFIWDTLKHKSVGFTKALEQTFKKIAQSSIVGSLKEAVDRGDELGVQSIRAPRFGVKKIAYKLEKEQRTHLGDRVKPFKGYQVLLDDKEQGRVLLYKKLSYVGEIWLEWGIEEEPCLVFRPRGALGKLFWLTSQFGLKRFWYSLNNELYKTSTST